MIDIMHKKRNFILSWITVLLWLILIFFMSAQPAVQSNNLSIGITQIIVETVNKVAPNADIDISSFNHLVRKNAHFFAYLLLGVLTLNAFRRSGTKGRKACAIALLFCALYAISDEAHQSFVPGRSAQVLDVLIDSAGAMVGILIYVAGGYLVNRVLGKDSSLRSE